MREVLIGIIGAVAGAVVATAVKYALNQNQRIADAGGEEAERLKVQRAETTDTFISWLILGTLVTVAAIACLELTIWHVAGSERLTWAIAVFAAISTDAVLMIFYSVSLQGPMTRRNNALKRRIQELERHVGLQHDE